MEVTNARQRLLTNFEVLELLNEVRSEEGKYPKIRQIKPLMTVLYETNKYLQMTPAAVQNSEVVRKLIRTIEPFKLTTAEILQVINLRPASAVELQLIVEECEERLTEEQVEQLVGIVTECLPEPLSEVDENAVEEMAVKIDDDDNDEEQAAQVEDVQPVPLAQQRRPKLEQPDDEDVNVQ